MLAKAATKNRQERTLPEAVQDIIDIGYAKRKVPDTTGRQEKIFVSIRNTSHYTR